LKVYREDEAAEDEDFFDEEADVQVQKSREIIKKPRKLLKKKPKEAIVKRTFPVQPTAPNRGNEEEPEAVLAAHIPGEVGYSMQENKILDEVWARHQSGSSSVDSTLLSDYLRSPL